MFNDHSQDTTKGSSVCRVPFGETNPGNRGTPCRLKQSSIVK